MDDLILMIPRVGVAPFLASLSAFFFSHSLRSILGKRTAIIADHAAFRYLTPLPVHQAGIPSDHRRGPDWSKIFLAVPGMKGDTMPL
jgi:hypothetical protein